MWFGFRKLLAGTALVATATSMLSGTAASASAKFAADGVRAGLSAGQISRLQSEADRYLARTPGRQTALNEVKTTTGAELRIALPGEKQPRKLSARYDPCDGGTAPGWLCVYSGQYGTGSHFGMYDCVVTPMPWSGLGSWGDNQTTGTWTYYLFKDKFVYDKFQAKANNQDYNWTVVWWIIPCTDSAAKR
ncbi:hypothetical protein ACWEGE_41715 [Amycolatopsis sp. NPDC004747]